MKKYLAKIIIMPHKEESAQQTVDLSCRKLLTNLITETYSFQIQELAH